MEIDNENDLYPQMNEFNGPSQRFNRNLYANTNANSIMDENNYYTINSQVYLDVSSDNRRRSRSSSFRSSMNYGYRNELQNRHLSIPTNETELFESSEGSFISSISGSDHSEISGLSFRSNGSRRSSKGSVKSGYSFMSYDSRRSSKGSVKSGHSFMSIENINHSRNSMDGRSIGGISIDRYSNFSNASSINSGSFMMNEHRTFVTEKQKRSSYIPVETILFGSDFSENDHITLINNDKIINKSLELN